MYFLGNVKKTTRSPVYIGDNSGNIRLATGLTKDGIEGVRYKRKEGYGLAKFENRVKPYKKIEQFSDQHFGNSGTK